MTGQDNTPYLGDLYVMGAKLKANLNNATVKAGISISTSQISQIAIEVIDPGFKVLKEGLFKPRTPVQYKDLRYVVSSVSTSSDAGQPKIEVSCRPLTVQRLKDRKGSKAMNNASPSDFIVSECKAVGAKYVVQPSPKRTQVARDLPEADSKYDQDEYPSSWTTFVRLADELGYILFEMAGAIYFGKPTWFLARYKGSPLSVTYNSGTDSTRAENIPVCTRSLETKKVTIDVTLPLERAMSARVGHTMRLSGVPTFDGYYLITQVDFSFFGESGRLSVRAETPIDPEANPPVSKSTNRGGSGGGSGSAFLMPYNPTISQSVYVGSSDGAWPLPKKYKVGTPFGKRGSWAAGFHTGTDFPAPKGTPVYAVYDGTIEIGGWGSSYGNHVILKTGGKKYGYCHLSKVSVRSGQKVKAGQTLGQVGNTGRSFGNHLHLEYRVSPFKYGTNSKNPIPTLMKKGSGSYRTVSSSTFGLSAAVGEAQSSSKRLMSVLTSAGFKGDARDIAAGIVWAESGLDARILGDTTITTAKWGPSVGLFQIRSLKNPSAYSGDDAKRIASKLYDAEYNCKLAYSLSRKGTYWVPWSTYNHGSYKRFKGKDGTIKNWKGSTVFLGEKASTSGGATPYKAGRADSKSVNDFVGWALTRIGGKYVYGAARTNSVNTTVFDCSSLVKWALYRVGIKSFPYNTTSQVAYLKKYNVKLSLSSAYKKKGALLYRIGNGNHVAISLGNNKQTVEAVSSSLGIRKMSVEGRRWTEAYLVPGLRYN